MVEAQVDMQWMDGYTTSIAKYILSHQFKSVFKYASFC